MKKKRVFGAMVSILFGITFSLPVAAKKVDPNEEITTIIQEKADVDQQELSFKKPLRLKQVLWLALDRNPELKSRLAEAQISVAEMRQLGLIESPEIEFGTRFPVSSPGSKTAYDLKLTQNVIDLIQLPTRKKMGRSDYESKKWEIASGILRTLTDVKVAYYHYQASLQLRSFWQSNLVAAQSAAALAKEQRKAGNISDLDEAQNMALLKMAQLESSKATSEIKQARIELAKLIGLSASDPSWKIIGQLPRLPAKEPKLKILKEWAQVNRPDLLAQKYKIESKQSSLTLAKKAVFPRLNVGVGAEWDAEGSRGVGPVIQMGLPLLGHRRAGIQRANAELNFNQQVLSAMEQGVPYDLEQVYQRLALARQTLHFYQNEVLPMQERILSESLKHYNYMLLGNYQLLQAKQNQINAKRDSIQALLDYWIAHAELENLVGGNLEGSKASNQNKP